MFIPEFSGEPQTPWFDIGHGFCEVFLNTDQLINLDPLKKRGLINFASCFPTETYASLSA